nr:MULTISPECIES: methyltransferase domain-containing protein [unclassified Synechococcus]
MEVRRLDLSHDPLPREPFDLVWCRWVLMFLPEVEPLLDRLAASLSPGARLVIHEYIHWSSFGLHPHGEAVGRFGAAAMASLERAGWSVS